MYHVQVRGPDLPSIAGRVAAGVVERATGERLDVKTISLLRTGSRSGAWFEVVLDEGKNRQLRRIFAEVGVEVLRVVRIAIGPLVLGELAKGAWRLLTADEANALAGASTQARKLSGERRRDETVNSRSAPSGRSPRAPRSAR